MTKFIYNMQDELFHLPLEDFSTIKKLVDHIEAQGKQLRELNAAITKRNATIGKYEREKKELQKSNNYLVKKVDELNEGIRNSEDLTWKQKYEALLHSSEQAIGALQKKCQDYKNSESDAITSTIETLTKTNKELEEKNKKLEEKVKRLDTRIKELIILCDEEYDNNNELKEKNKKIDALEEENKELKDYISELENEVAGLKKELAFWKTDDKRSFFGESFDMHSIYDLNRLEEVIADKIKSYDSRLYSLMAERDKYKESSETYRLKLMAAENKRLEAEKKIADDRWWESEKELTKEKLAIKKLKRNNDILQGKVNEISDLAESIVMLCKDEE